VAPLPADAGAFSQARGKLPLEVAKRGGGLLTRRRPTSLAHARAGQAALPRPDIAGAPATLTI